MPVWSTQCSFQPTRGFLNCVAALRDDLGQGYEGMNLPRIGQQVGLYPGVLEGLGIGQGIIP